MKKVIVISLLFLAQLSAMGQNKVSFTYDEAGNRIRRDAIVPIAKSSLKEDLGREVTYEGSIGGKHVSVSTKESGNNIDVEVLGISNRDKGTISVYTSSGIMIATKSIAGTTTGVDLASNPDGLYIISITINRDKNAIKIVKGK